MISEDLDEILELDVGYFTIRQTVAARIVTIEAVVLRQFPVKMPPYRALQIEFQMRHPVAGLDQRRTLANARIGDLHAVLALAEANLLFVRDGRGRNRFR